MKIRKKLSLILMVLICILLILIGFVGVYEKDINKYINKIPKYKLSSDLKGSTIFELTPDSSNKTTYYDKDGKKVDETSVTEENKNDYTKEELPVNNEEVLNKENYESTLKILKERLKFLRVDQYSLDLDEKTGKIILTFEDDYPEDVKNILPMEGKLELEDSNSSDIILDYSNIKSIQPNYAQNEDGYTVFVDIKLTDEGVAKINDIDKYKNAEKKTDDTENNDETSSTETKNKFKILFDKEQIEEIEYENLSVNNNNLKIIIEENITTTSTINSKLNILTVVSELTKIGKTPVVYQLSAQEYVNSSIDAQKIYVGLAIAAIIMIVIFLYFIIKYKNNGVLAFIATFANVALFTLLIRYTNIEISLNSFAAIAGLIILDVYLILNILNEMKNSEKTFGQKLRTAYIKTIDLIIIALILFAVFSFSSMKVISAMGLLLFWGWFVIVVGNLLLTAPMLKIGGKE